MSRSLELLTDACAKLKMTPRKMFGGHGFFAPNGGMFAGILSDDAIIFKLVVGPLRDELISLGGYPWTYQGRDRPTTMNEWIVVPESFYDDGDALEAWAKKAHGAVPAKKLALKKNKKKAAPKKPEKKSAKKRRSP
ncbi:MAG: TfoX/Sxy family protein [Archangiaceae bacterium]|nr:TfoX/Sxy family protein [Archangiaceae bacterium]